MGATINALLNSSPIWTSEFTLQAKGRLNVSIKIGASLIEDPTASTFSGTITLQRQFGDVSDVAGSVWRDVDNWAVLAASARTADSENITNPEPETAIYRLGCKTGDWDAGAAFVRLGSQDGKAV